MFYGLKKFQNKETHQNHSIFLTIAIHSYHELRIRGSKYNSNFTKNKKWYFILKRITINSKNCYNMYK